MVFHNICMMAYFHNATWTSTVRFSSTYKCELVIIWPIHIHGDLHLGWKILKDLLMEEV